MLGEWGCKPLRKKIKRASLEFTGRLVYALTKCRGPVNDRELRVLGMQRSGNHAVLNWILKQSDEPSCVLNFAAPDTNPFLTFHWGSTMREIAQDFKGKFDYRRERVGLFSKKASLIVTYEDDPVEDVFTSLFESCRPRWIGESKEKYGLLILRDPYNLAASRIKRERGGLENKIAMLAPDGPARFADVWINNAKEFIGESASIPHKKINVNFNRWGACQDYRRRTAEVLGLVFTDHGADEVSDVGGGSSFGRKDPRRDISGRWREFAADPAFLQSVRHPEMTRLSEEIFGPIDGVRESLGL